MVCRRFALVREDTEKALISQVEGIIPELRKAMHDSDSSGLSDEWELQNGDMEDEEGESAWLRQMWRDAINSK